MADHLTFVEREILYRLKKQGHAQSEIAKLMGRHPSTIGRELRRSTGRPPRRKMRDLPESWRRSITFDNGKEFAEHDQIAEQLGVEVYFALPYRSWQRGANENTNGLIRQFFPKGTDFTRISHQTVARAETLLNERPRTRLGYQTPAEVFAKRTRCN